VVDDNGGVRSMVVDGNDGVRWRWGATAVVGGGWVGGDKIDGWICLEMDGHDELEESQRGAIHENRESFADYVSFKSPEESSSVLPQTLQIA
nr:hypothetical protein [Tanacetum cinerariifolium]